MRKMNFQGLSSEEAARLLAEIGPNEQPKAPRPGLLAIALRALKEPMFFLLASAALLYLFVGDLGEGLFMVAGAGASITLVILQEQRTERGLEALNRLAEPTAMCRRDGVERRIPALDLVPGGEQTPFLFAGTMIARGSGLAVVVRTGAHTAMGRLGASLAAIEGEHSPLQ